MPRKATGRSSSSAPKDLWIRLRDELRTGRFPQALELARKFYSLHPGEAAQTALQQALMGQIDQLLQSDRILEASRHLDEAEKVGGAAPEWMEKLAILRAKAGDWLGATRLLNGQPGTTATSKAISCLVDRGLRDPKNGKLLLPPELHAGFDAIVSAFSQHEHGEDEAARTSLQAIGMQSPFLDWKLLLRGIMAYSANDDARALENWQRLDATRLPAQLAAPLRFQIDAGYRGGLSPNLATHLANRSDQLTLPLLSSLRKVQRKLASPQHLSEALRLVRPLIGKLQLSFPQLVSKLGNCFYWLIVLGGEPDDLEEYETVFGEPADDPKFNRLVAMVMESAGRLEEAHRNWNKYADWIATQPGRFPGEFGKRARAMIYLRMGDDAIEYDSVSASPEDFLDFLRRELHNQGNKRPLKPSAETCYRNAMELAPDWKEPLGRLLDHYANQGLWEKAEPIGRRLVEQFPDDSESLIQLSKVLYALKKNDEALNVLRAALKHHPLDGTLRGVVALSTLRLGREQTIRGDYAAARATFQESLNLDPQVLATVTRASWAACEFKAGCGEVAQRLVAEVQAVPKMRVAAAFLLLAEISRVKAAKAILSEFRTRFDEILNGSVQLQEFLHLLIAWNQYRNVEDRYHGFGTHEKKILGKVQHFVDSELSEQELARFGMMLVELKAPKPLKMLVEKGLVRFATTPAFMFLQAEQMILQRPKSFNMYQVGALFAHVLEQIESRHDALHTTMREMIDRRCDENPQLRDFVARQREILRALPQFGKRRTP